LPLSLLLAIGVHQWLGCRWPRLTLLAVGLAFFTFSTWVLFAFVRPLYPLPAIAAAEQVTAAQQANVQFGDALALIGYQVDAAGIAPGESGEITLFWQPLGNSRPDLYLKLRVLDAAGNVVYATETWPLPSSSTSIWENEHVYITSHSIDIAPTAVIGAGMVEISLQPGKEGQPVTAAAFDPASTLRFPQLFLGQKSHTSGIEPAVLPEQTITLGEHITLLGHDIQIERANDPILNLTLYWQTDASLAENYTVFVHILDENGRLLAQQDSQPNHGLYPTSTWDANAIIRDAYAIPLPANIGDFTIQTGMYTWPSLERLHVTQNGRPAGSAVILSTIEKAKD